MKNEKILSVLVMCVSNIKHWSTLLERYDHDNYGSYYPPYETACMTFLDCCEFYGVTPDDAYPVCKSILRHRHNVRKHAYKW